MIKKGDYLTSASKAGYAMKALSAGRVIGIALEDYTLAMDEENNHAGKVLVFVNPHTYMGVSFTEKVGSKLSRYATLMQSTMSEFGVTFTDDGKVGIGEEHPLVLLHTKDTRATGTVARFQNISGYCDIDPTTKSLVCTTDDALRTNQYLIDSTSTVATSSDITATSASTTLEKLTQLHVVSYYLPTDDIISSSTHTGLIINDIKTLFPGLVKVDSEGTESLSLTNFIPYIIESIKTIAFQIGEMKNIFVTKEICVGTADSKTCLTKEKVDQLLLLQSTTNASASTSTSTPDTPSSELLPVVSSSTDVFSETTNNSTSTIETNQFINTDGTATSTAEDTTTETTPELTSTTTEPIPQTEETGATTEQVIPEVTAPLEEATTTQ